MVKKTLSIVLFVFIFSCMLVRTTHAYVFDTDLSIGSRGEAVTELQRVLKDLNFFTYPTITDLFGSATRHAVELFQSSKGIADESTQGYGRVGPATRDALNAIDTTQTTPVASSGSTFTHDLELGMTGSDVMVLQQFLNTHGFPIAATGPGSAGNETELFQKATRAALQQFQSANGISPVNGRFGPLTRAKVNSLLSTPIPTAPSEVTLVPAQQALSAPILSAPSVQSTQISLSWTPVPGATSYMLQRKENSETAYTTIASTISGQTYTDTSVQNYKIYSYMLTAVISTGENLQSNVLIITTGLMSGGSGGSTSGGSSTPTDSVAPTISITTPTDGITVHGTNVTVTADASDNVGVAGVTFLDDGVIIGSEDIAAPFTVTWDTTHAVDGANSLTAVARDAEGNSTISTAITVTVDNSAPSISAIASTPSSTSADISWTTDENGTSHVDYGLTTSYGLTSDDATLTASHAVTLSGLSSNKIYHYKVSSTDAAGNTSASSDKTFTTTFLISYLPHWSTAVNNALSGTANARVLFLGDSTTAGYDPTNGTLSNNNKAESTPTVIASLFPNSLGGIASFTGNQNVPNSSTYDNRTSFIPGGWGFSPMGGGEVLGGYALESQTAHSNFTFDPGTQWDTAELYYTTFPGGGSADVSINGTTSIGTLSLSSGSNGFSKTMLTKTLGADTLTTSLTSGSQYDLQGYVLYNSSHKEITVLNAGWSGATAEDVAGNSFPWTSVNEIGTYDPDLVVIDLGINDWDKSTATDETTFKSSMQSIIDAAKNAGSDVLLVVPVPSGSANGIAHQAAFQTYIHDLSVTNDLPVVDFIMNWGSWAQANTNGWMSDDLHPNAAGYAEKAHDIFNFIWQ